MNDIMKTVKSQATKLATAVASHELNVWPPVCFGIYFQPERPYQIQVSTETPAIQPKLNLDKKQF